MREVLEEIIAHADGVDASTLEDIRRYTKLFWINTGPHNNLTARKFVLEVLARGVCGGCRGGAAQRRPISARPGESLDGCWRGSSRCSSTPTSIRS